jgi:hypothetical protein
MKDNYDFTNAKKNPYAEGLKNGCTVTVRYGPDDNAWDDVKEKIKALLEILPERDAERLLSYIVENFDFDLNDTSWESINEVTEGSVSLAAQGA